MVDAIAGVMQRGLTTKADRAPKCETTRAELRETELRLEAKIEATKADLIKGRFA